MEHRFELDVVRIRSVLLSLFLVRPCCILNVVILAHTSGPHFR